MACGAAATDPPPKPPAEGVMLLSLRTGAVLGQRSLGEDPLAVSLAPGGGTAYVADNELGDVFALRLPSLQQAWRTHVGGAPGPMLVDGDRLFVSEYAAGVVAELDRGGGHLIGTRPAGPHPGQLVLWQGRVTAAGGAGFGLADVEGSLWTWARLPARPGLHPFWLAPGGGSDLLVTEEGRPEDSAPGSVLSIGTVGGQVTVLASPRDPDQAVRSGTDVFVAAHGDHDVLVLRGGHALRWAPGAEAVALAPDPALGVLVVVTDAGE